MLVPTTVTVKPDEVLDERALRPLAVEAFATTPEIVAVAGASADGVNETLAGADGASGEATFPPQPTAVALSPITTNTPGIHFARIIRLSLIGWGAMNLSN